MRRMAIWVAAVGLGLGALAGCGSDEGTSGGSGTSNSSSESGGSDQSGSDTGSDSGTSGGSDTAASGDSAAFCDKVKTMSLGALNMKPGSDNSELAKMFEEVAAVAPSEVKKDWTTVAEGMAKLSEFTATPSPGADPQEQMEKLKELQKVSKDLQASAKAIRDDVQKYC